jgi:putative transcriptional regulator
MNYTIYCAKVQAIHRFGNQPTIISGTLEFDAEALVGSIEAFAAHVQGKQKLTLRTNQLSLPAPIKPIGPEDITALRQKLNVSQAVFAGLLNVPKVTAISWEKGRRRPTGAALRLLDLIRKKPQILQEA